MVATRKEAIVDFERFMHTHAAKYPKAAEKAVGDRDALRPSTTSRRALGAIRTIHHRIHVPHSASSHRAHAQLRLVRDVSSVGVQTLRGSREILAAHSRGRTNRIIVEGACRSRAGAAVQDNPPLQQSLAA